MTRCRRLLGMVIVVVVVITTTTFRCSQIGVVVAVVSELGQPPVGAGGNADNAAATPSQCRGR